MDRYDVIVIGGGHAGAEAATLAARRGARTLLLTQNLETIGQMSCNPAIGGIAKGTVVREVDALGGVMGRATDLARIQFRMLNKSKGPAVWSPRAQCDRGLYRRAVRSLLELQPNLEFAQGTVASLIVSDKCINGVVTLDGRTYYAPAVVLTAGTFLRGRIHLGLDTQVPAGRAGEAPATEIAHQIEELGLTVKRFKTGTPPRIDGRSADLSRMLRQDGDPGAFWFSFYQRAGHPEQRPCYLTHTGAELQEIVLRHLRQSALYGGAISGRGPRYCPSIEDKVLKFPDAEHHQVFLEPEGLDTSEMYVNGLSTSLPPSVQLEFLRSVPGLEQVLMTRPGYAIEYDYFPPTQLHPTLESRHLPGLFFAGQVNGTTGYEEAAAQGAVAGINASARALDLDSIVFGRGEAFLGVLTDDLVTKGVDEPYRLIHVAIRIPAAPPARQCPPAASPHRRTPGYSQPAGTRADRDQTQRRRGCPSRGRSNQHLTAGGESHPRRLRLTADRRVDAGRRSGSQAGSSSHQTTRWRRDRLSRRVGRLGGHRIQILRVPCPRAVGSSEADADGRVRYPGRPGVPRPRDARLRGQRKASRPPPGDVGPCEPDPRHFSERPPRPHP